MEKRDSVARGGSWRAASSPTTQAKRPPRQRGLSGKEMMNNPDDTSGERGCGSLERMVRAIRDLLDNPYPWDLVQIRHLVHSDFGGDEEAAKAEMVTYCSAKYCEDAMARYLEFKRAACEVVRAHCPNVRMSEGADK